MDRIELTDPRALRAYAHPIRMQLVGLLRREGPLTATRAADLTGESVASCSYHLRQLAKYGLVEASDEGQGREKPWRATARSTWWPGHSDDPAVAEAAHELGVSIVRLYYDEAVKWLDRRTGEPPEWQDAGDISDDVACVTASELTALTAAIDALMAPYEVRRTDPSQRPAGARFVHLIRMALPR